MAKELMYVTMTKYANGAPQEKWVFTCHDELEATLVSNNARLLQVFKQIRTRYPVAGRVPSYSHMRTLYWDRVSQPTFYEDRDVLESTVGEPLRMIFRSLITSGISPQDIRIDISVNQIIDSDLAESIQDNIDGLTFTAIEGYPALIHKDINVAITPFQTQRVNFHRAHNQELNASQVDKVSTANLIEDEF